jgi:hypothetical protein
LNQHRERGSVALDAFDRTLFNLKRKTTPILPSVI